MLFSNQNFRHLAAAFTILLLLPCGIPATGAESYGRFEGEVCTLWNKPDSRSMTLCAPFAYVDPAGLQWPVPKGTVVDGASIPQAFWSIIGGPFEGPYRNASVVHDYYCVIRTRQWQDVHRMFYYGMLAAGTNAAKAKAMYYAVYVGGPRWKKVLYTNHEPRAFGKPGDIDEIKMVAWKVTFDQKAAQKDVTWIEQNNPSLDQIEELASRVVQSTEPKDRVRIDLE